MNYRLLEKPGFSFFVDPFSFSQLLANFQELGWDRIKTLGAGRASFEKYQVAW